MVINIFDLDMSLAPTATEEDNLSIVIHCVRARVCADWRPAQGRTAGVGTERTGTDYCVQKKHCY